MTTINWPTVSVISTGSSGGITSFSSSQEGQVLFKGISGDGSTAIFRDLVAGPNITLTSGSNLIEISGSTGGVTSLSSSQEGEVLFTGVSGDGTTIGFRDLVAGPNITLTSGTTSIEISGSASGITSLSSSQEGEILFKGVSGDGTTASFRDLIAGPNITLTSGSNSIEISGSSGDTLPSANKGDILMFSSTEWTTGSYLSKYVVGPDPTDRYSNLGDAIAAVVSDGANVSPINPAIIYVKPKLGTSSTYSIGSISMPPNITIQGISYGTIGGLPAARLVGSFTFSTSNSNNAFKNISLNNSSGNVINVTGNGSRVYISNSDVRAEGTATAININGANSRIYIDNGSAIVSTGNQPVIKNANGFLQVFGAVIQQEGSSFIAYNSTQNFNSAYASFYNSIIKGELHFTTNGGVQVNNCNHILGSNSAYPVEFDNAGSPPNEGRIVYKNTSIQYTSGLTGPSGPWVNVIAGTASLYVGNVVLDEVNLRTVNPYTDNVYFRIHKSQAEVSTSFIRRTFIKDEDPTDRFVLRYYDNGSTPEIQWQHEEPVSSSNNASITVSDNSITRHLLCTNTSNRSVTLYNANVKQGSFTIVDAAGTAASAPISVTGSGDQTINGDRTIASNYGAATFVSDGSAIWYRIS